MKNRFDNFSIEGFEIFENISWNECLRRGWSSRYDLHQANGVYEPESYAQNGEFIVKVGNYKIRIEEPKGNNGMMTVYNLFFHDGKGYTATVTRSRRLPDGRIITSLKVFHHSSEIDNNEQSPIFRRSVVFNASECEMERLWIASHLSMLWSTELTNAFINGELVPSYEMSQPVCVTCLKKVK